MTELRLNQSHRFLRVGQGLYDAGIWQTCSAQDAETFKSSDFLMCVVVVVFTQMNNYIFITAQAVI